MSGVKGRRRDLHRRIHRRSHSENSLQELEPQLRVAEDEWAFVQDDHSFAAKDSLHANRLYQRVEKHDNFGIVKMLIREPDFASLTRLSKISLFLIGVRPANLLTNFAVSLYLSVATSLLHLPHLLIARDCEGGIASHIFSRTENAPRS